jgi:hypothetical protein
MVIINRRLASEEAEQMEFVYLEEVGRQIAQFSDSLKG